MKMMYSKIAIVTGASAGIGEAITRKFIAAGFGVVANARRKEKLDSLAQELGEAVCPVAGDASDPAVLESLFEHAHEFFGREADIVVANAGRGLGGSVTTANLSEYEEVIKINIIGTVELLQKASRRMQADLSIRPYPKYSHDIVVIGSTVGRHVSPFSAIYGATKFGINSIAEALRREIGPKGIRVSLFEPGIVSSEFQEVAGYSSELVSGFEERFGPLLVGEDIAASVHFVVSQAPHVHINDVMIRPTRQDYP